MEIVFLFLIFVIVHSYLFYPVIIKVISLFFKKEKFESNDQLTVSVIISVYNEGKVINDRISNIANLNYDFTKIEVLVGSDCSTDRTNQILDELKSIYPWLAVFLFEKRRGKVSVLNDLVKKAKNEIILFTDANTVFDRDIIPSLILNFNDPVIGGVSGRLKLIERGNNSENKTEEKKYWEYETVIKRHEGKCGVLIGANGGIFAIRKNLFKEIPIERPVTDDLFISLAVLQQNYKFVYESNAVAFEEVAPKFIDEFKRKIRFGATNFHTLIYFRSLLFNKNILLSYSLWAHKVSRWLTPILLILIFLLNIILFDKAELYRVLLLLQLSFLLLAGLGILLKKINIYISPLVMIFYFLMTNVALLIGLFKFFFGKQTAFWQSTPR
jgi:cellulose synthase/poly-beta-1,6-N-acetylglucosamine synthase-like glycosyltransferase